MPRLSTAVADVFSAHIDALEATRLKLEGILASGQIASDDIERVYAGLYLSAFTEFEGLIEELFFGLLSGAVTSGLATPCLDCSSSAVVREVMMIGPRKYLDWLPYDKTLERAKVLFKDGKPFSLLQKAQAEGLFRFLRVRNALAHKSEYALKQFEDDVIGGAPLLPHERTPTGFLRSTYRTSPPQCQYENTVQELRGMAYVICQ
jgi:hypothetical protein